MAGQDDNNRTRSTREQLTSNTINYMVWRYLQEAGFAMAATWLGREWHKHPDDVMPFAKHVKQQQLVHMLQDATFLDDVKSRGHRENHRYYFGDDHGPLHALPSYDISGSRKPEDIPSKRFGQSNGVNGAATAADEQESRLRPVAAVRVPNGDVMDIDEAKMDESEHASEVESPAQAEQEVAPLLDTLTIGESKTAATEKPINITNTSSKLPWPDKCLISKAAWSHFGSNALLIGGVNTLRIFGVKHDPTEEVLAKDVRVSEQEFEVGELCWTSNTDAVVAVSETLEAGDEETMAVGKLLQVTGWGSDDLHTITSMAGAIFALRYNKASGLLMSLSGGDSTTITIYKLDGPRFVSYAASSLDQIRLFDAVWMNESRFIACGTNILQIFDVVGSRIVLVQTQEMKNSWFQIAYDAVCDIAVFVDESHTALRQYNVGTEDTKTHVFTDTQVTHFQFQPIADVEAGEPRSGRLLATSTDDGHVQLWDATQPFTCIQCLQVPGSTEGYLKQISFSPDGALLAAAGFDTAVVWELRDMEGVLRTIWRCMDDAEWQSRPDLEEDEDGWEWGHDLQWGTGGEQLVFTLKDQAVVMRMPQTVLE